MNPKAVVFDIGGVLIDWDPAHLYRKLLPDEVSLNHFLTNVCTTEWNQQFDAGAFFADGIMELSRKHPEQADLISSYWERWLEMIQGEIPGTPGVLRALKAKGIPVHAISNWSAETFPLAASRFPFLNLFEVLIVSGREKLIKPGMGIFKLFLNRAGLNPEDCVFIDDNAANIATASSMGFHTVHFVDANDLTTRLISFGLLDHQLEMAS